MLIGTVLLPEPFRRLMYCLHNVYCKYIVREVMHECRMQMEIVHFIACFISFLHTASVFRRVLFPLRISRQPWPLGLSPVQLLRVGSHAIPLVQPQVGDPHTFIKIGEPLFQQMSTGYGLKCTDSMGSGSTGSRRCFTTQGASAKGSQVSFYYQSLEFEICCMLESLQVTTESTSAWTQTQRLTCTWCWPTTCSTRSQPTWSPWRRMSRACPHSAVRSARAVPGSTTGWPWPFPTCGSKYSKNRG